jgi:hypothetical protein
VSVSIGYGLHAWDFPFQNILQLTMLINVAGTLSITAAIWSKTSFAFTLLRLTHGWLKGAVWFIIISMNIAMGLSALFIWIKCAPIEKSWNGFIDGVCWSPEFIVYYNIFSAGMVPCPIPPESSVRALY